MTEPRASAPARSAMELLRVTPFGELGEDALAKVAPLFVRVRAGKGAVVFLEGDEGDRFFVVAGGRLKAFRHTASARDVTVFTLGPGDSFGFLPLLDGGPFPLSAAALTAAELLVLHRPQFLRFIDENPRFCLALVTHLARRLRGCFEQVESLGRSSAVARVAHGLLRLLPANVEPGAAVEVLLPFSQAEFAQFLNITPENLSRALTQLRREGAVERSGRGRFRIRDVEVLSGFAEPSA